MPAPREQRKPQEASAAALPPNAYRQDPAPQERRKPGFFAPAGISDPEMRMGRSIAGKVLSPILEPDLLAFKKPSSSYWVSNPIIRRSSLVDSWFSRFAECRS